MATVTHVKVSAIADDAASVAAGEVVPSDWNAAHSVTLVDADIPATIARDAEVTTAVSDHAALSDPHTGYRLESADHTHASTGLQGGTVAYSAITGTPAAPPATNTTIHGYQSAGGAGSGTMPINELLVGQIQIPVAVTLTGVIFKNGSVQNGSLKVALYDASGTRVAVSAATAQGGTFSHQTVAFTGTYSAAAGVYYLAFVSNSATAQFMVVGLAARCVNIAADSYTTVPASITAPSLLLGYTIYPPEMTTY